MTDSEAIELLEACKPLAERLSAIAPSVTPVNLALSKEDMVAMQGFARVQNDPIIAGPGLLGRLLKTAGLTQVEIYRLGQLMHLLNRRRFEGRKANTSFMLGSNTKPERVSKPESEDQP